MRSYCLIFACFLILALSSGQDDCKNLSCKFGEPQIRFPFRLQGSQPNRCGYPGFDLTCDGSNVTILRLKNSSFSVQQIDYVGQQILLNDPNECLPRLLLTLNLSGTPFEGASLQVFTLFNCSSNSTIPFGFEPISCLSDDPNYAVIAAASSRATGRLFAASCTVMRSISVPVLRLFPWQSGTSVLSEDIRLMWDEPLCGRCESREGICRLRGNSVNDYECRYRHGVAGSTRYIITLSTGIPAILFAIGIVCFVIKKFKSSDRGQMGLMNSRFDATAIVAPQQITISGLDQAVIESFPKTILGESRRLPNPEDNVCAICLSEYKPKESLRTIPICRHCFHSSCIDEWLRLNATCPVCRKYQEQLPPVPETGCVHAP